MGKGIVVGIVFALLFALATAFFAIPVSGLINVNSCGQLTTSNEEYNLTQSLTSNDRCLNITGASNVTFQGNGFTITHGNTVAGWGMNVSGNWNNVTVKNVTFAYGGAASSSVRAAGLWVGVGNNFVVDNVTLTGLQNTGIVLANTSGGVLNNSVLRNGNSGFSNVLTFSASTANVRIENTYVNSTDVNCITPVGGDYLWFNNITVYCNGVVFVIPSATTFINITNSILHGWVSVPNAAPVFSFSGTATVTDIIVANSSLFTNSSSAATRIVSMTGGSGTRIQFINNTMSAPNAPFGFYFVGGYSHVSFVDNIINSTNTFGIVNITAGTSTTNLTFFNTVNIANNTFVMDRTSTGSADVNIINDSRGLEVNMVKNVTNLEFRRQWYLDINVTNSTGDFQASPTLTLRNVTTGTYGIFNITAPSHLSRRYYVTEWAYRGQVLINVSPYKLNASLGLSSPFEQDYENASIPVSNNTQVNVQMLSYFPDIYNCGNVTTSNTNYVLKKSLSSSTNCLSFTGQNMTLDLGGYTIDGDGSHDYEKGVEILGSSFVVIRNGTIRDFGKNVLINQSASVNISDIYFTGGGNLTAAGGFCAEATFTGFVTVEDTNSTMLRNLSFVNLGNINTCDNGDSLYSIYAKNARSIEANTIYVNNISADYTSAASGFFYNNVNDSSVKNANISLIEQDGVYVYQSRNVSTINISVTDIEPSSGFLIGGNVIGVFMNGVRGGSIINSSFFNVDPASWTPIGYYLYLSSDLIFENNRIDTLNGMVSSGVSVVSVNNSVFYNTVANSLMTIDSGAKGVDVVSSRNLYFWNTTANNVYESAFHVSGGSNITAERLTITNPGNSAIYASGNNLTFSNFSIDNETGLWSGFAGHINAVYGNNIVFTDGTINRSIISPSAYLAHVNNTIVRNVVLDSSNNKRIEVNVRSINTSLTNITILNANYSKLDLNISSTANNTAIINSYFANYSIDGIGSLVSYELTSSGKISFNERVNGSGTNLSSDIFIAHNYAYVNDGANPGLNRSANISLYGNPSYGRNPSILRGGVLCGSCTNITSLRQTNVVFSVPGFSNYTLGDKALPNITFVSPTPANGGQVMSSLPINISSADQNRHYVFTKFNDDLRFWMRFESTNSSGDPIDSTTYGHNGTLYNGVTLNQTSGVFGEAAQFDGIDDRIVVENRSTIHGTNFTLSFWVAMSGNLSGTFQRVFTKAGSGGFYVMKANSYPYLEFALSNTTGSTYTYRPLAALQQDVWTHVAFTYDGASNNIKAYYNGTLISSTHYTAGGIAGPVGIGTNPLTIGATNGGGQYLNGSVDDVMIFDRALSAAEIRSLYNASAYQYDLTFTGLAEAAHNITGYAVDAYGNVNQTEERQIIVNASHVTDCAVLSIANREYVLQNSVYVDGTCFSVNAENVTLNLNGYSVVGNDGCCNLGNYYTGVETKYSGTRVLHGTITNFTYGIFASPSDDMVVNNVTLSTEGQLGDSVYPHAIALSGTTGANLTNIRVPLLTSQSADLGVAAIYVNGVRMLLENITLGNVSGVYYGAGVYATNQVGLSVINAYVENVTAGIIVDSSRNVFMQNAQITRYMNGLELNTVANLTMTNFSINGSTSDGSGINAAGINASSFINVTIANVIGTGVYLASSSSTTANYFEKVSFVNNSILNVQIITPGSNFTFFNDTTLSKYNITGSGATLGFQNSTNGIIQFIRPVNGSITAVGAEIAILNNQAFVNDTASSGGFNKSANVTLFNVPQTYLTPAIFRNSALCGNSCTNFTGLNLSTVAFNVTAWSTYSIGEGEYLVTDCRVLGAANQYYAQQQNIASTQTCIVVNASNITFNGANYAVVYGNQSSSSPYYGIHVRAENSTVANVSVSRGSAATKTQDRFGVFIENVSRTIVQTINGSQNLIGIYALHANYTILQSSNTSYNGRGVFFNASSFVNITGLMTSFNSINDTLNNETYGLLSDGGQQNIYDRMTVNNNTGTGGSGFSRGISILNANRVVLNNSVINDNIVTTGDQFTSSGIFTSNVANSTFQNLTLLRNPGAGIWIGTNYNTINDIRINASYWAMRSSTTTTYTNISNIIFYGNSYGLSVSSTFANNILTNISAFTTVYDVIGLLNSNTLQRSFIFGSTYTGITLAGTANTISDVVINGTTRQAILISGASNIVSGTNISSAGSAGYPSVSISSSTNNFTHVIINNSRNNGVQTSGTAQNNTFLNLSFTNSNRSFYDLNLSGNFNGTQFIDNYAIGNYSLNGTGGRIRILKNAHGGINFLSSVNGTGSNFSADIVLTSNYAFVNETANLGLNASANVTFYNFPALNRTARILLNDVVCSTCYNLTSLFAQNVTFNVTGWSNYTIGDKTVPNITFVAPTPANTTINSNAWAYINVSSQDVSGHYVLTDYDATNVLWLRMDDVNSTTDPQDLSSYSNHASREGAIQRVATGKFGYGFDYDGVDDYLRVADANSLDIGTNDFTLSAWMRVAVPDQDTFRIISKRSSGDVGYEMLLEAGSDVINYFLGDGAFFVSGDVGTTNIRDGAWHHVVFVFDRDDRLYYYLDGVNDANVTDITAHQLSVANTDPLYIGRYGPSADAFFNGGIDDVSIFNRALSATEVRALFNASVTQYQRNFSGLAQGAHTFKASATDQWGNLNTTGIITYTVNESYLTECGLLDTANFVYYLQNNVTTSDTCFSIDAQNVTLHGQNYVINHSTGGSGYGVDLGGQNKATLRNITFINSGTENSVYLRGAPNATLNSLSFLGAGDSAIAETGGSISNLRIENSTFNTTGSTADILLDTITDGAFQNNVHYSPLVSYLATTGSYRVTIANNSFLGSSGYAIRSTDFDNSSILNNIINTSATSSVGLRIDTSTKSYWVGNNYFRLGSDSTVASLPEFSIVYNNTIDMSDKTNVLGFDLLSADNTIFENNTIRLGQNSIGANIDGLGGATIANNNISSVDHLGLNIVSSSDSTFRKNSINTSGTGIFITAPSANLRFIDLDFVNAKIVNVSRSDPNNVTNITFLNSSHVTENFMQASAGLQLVRQWYTDVNVTHIVAGGLANARVNITNRTGTTYITGLTPSGGILQRLNVTQYVATGVGYTYFAPQHLNVTLTGYNRYDNATSNVTGNGQLNVSLLNSSLPQITQYAPSTTSFSIFEYESQDFSINYTNPNLDNTVRWYLNGTLVQSSQGSAMTSTSAWVGNSSASGIYNITVLVNNTNGAVLQEWTMTAIDVTTGYLTLTANASTVSVERGESFTYTVNATCNAGSCSNVTLWVDPFLQDESGNSSNDSSNTSSFAWYLIIQVTVGGLAIVASRKIKAQSATEYIIIGGVVLVITGIVAGTLGGLGSITSQAQERAMTTKLLSQPIAITSHAIDLNVIKISLKNTQQVAYKVSRITISGVTITTGDLPVVLSPGEETVVYSQSVRGNRSGDTYALPVQVFYSDVETGVLDNTPDGLMLIGTIGSIESYTKGTLTTDTGSVPFYIDGALNYYACGNLNSSNTCQYSFTVVASGSNGVYEFFGYGLQQGVGGSVESDHIFINIIDG